MKSSEEKIPTIIDSSARNATMYSRTWMWIEIQLAPLDSMMNAAPTSGRKVISESSGQWLTGSPFLSPRHEIPGDQPDDADQHGKGVVIDVAGLQPACLARQFAGRGGDPIRPEPIDYL